MKGDLHAVASLAGLLGSPRLDVQATARKVTFDSIPFETITATAKYNPGDGLSTAIEGSSAMGKAGVRATASIAPLFYKPHLASWNAVAKADIPRLSRPSPARLGRKYSFLSGAAHIEASSRRPGARELPNHGDLVLAVKQSAAPGFAELIDCHVRLNNRNWSADVRRIPETGSMHKLLSAIDPMPSPVPLRSTCRILPGYRDCSLPTRLPVPSPEPDSLAGPCRSQP